MNRSVRRLLGLMLVAIGNLTAALEQGELTVPAWREQLAQELVRGHTAALMLGQGARALTDQGRQALRTEVAKQLRFLGNFAIEIQGASAWKKGWNARALLYAESIGASYWRGKTRFLPLPAMPRDGTTQCKTRCGCSWQIAQLAGRGNYDCTWQVGPREHCQTCIERARLWAPLRIRGGELQ